MKTPWVRRPGRRPVWAPVLPTVLLCIACCAGAGGRLRPQAFSADALRFDPCPKEVAVDGVEMECALVEVPLDWASPDTSPRIAVFVRRLPAPRGRGAAHQLWALDGGPGFAGDAFTDAAFREIAHSAGYDLYIPTHRGTAYGTALSCPAMRDDSDEGVLVSPEELPACLEHLRGQFGDDWTQFDAAAAALDVRHLLQRTPTDGRRVAFGGSYGSYWGQRLLQRAPEQFDGMWLDSVVDLQASFERADANSDRAGRALLQACETHEACAAHFIDSATDTAERVLQGLRSDNGCGAHSPPLSHLQRLLFRLLSGSPSEMALVAPVLRRAERCEEADAQALSHALTELERDSRPRPSEFAYNPLLNKHVLFRELYRFDRTAQDIEREAQNLLFSAGADAPLSARSAAYDASFRRPPPSEVPVTDTHLVLVQGGLDPLDRPEWARRSRERWSAAPVTLIEVPHAGHSVVRYAITHDGEHCTSRMLRAFLEDPQAPLERGCLDQLRPLDLGATQKRTLDAAERWLGTADVWGEATTAAKRPHSVGRSDAG